MSLKSVVTNTGNNHKSTQMTTNHQKTTPYYQQTNTNYYQTTTNGHPCTSNQKSDVLFLFRAPGNYKKHYDLKK